MGGSPAAQSYRGRWWCPCGGLSQPQAVPGSSAPSELRKSKSRAPTWSPATLATALLVPDQDAFELRLLWQ